MKMIFESIIGNKFINQHPLRFGNAISNERHQVAVVDAANYIDLCLKFPLPLSAIRFQTLHRNFLPIR